MSPSLQSYLIDRLLAHYTIKFYFQKCAELKGDDGLCEEVVILSTLELNDPKKWTETQLNQTKTFVNRAWNDPEFSRIYDMYDNVVKSIDLKVQFKQYTTVYGK